MKEPLESLILNIRGQKVLLDADLAAIYGVETRQLNQAVKRNAARFPADLAFRLTAEQWMAWKTSGSASGPYAGALKSQIVILKQPGRGQHRKFLTMAFTEHGAIMAATVLNSPEAIKMSLFVIRAFVQMREHLAANAEILRRLAEIDRTLLQHDAALSALWRRLQPLLEAPSVAKSEDPAKEIGFHVRDASARYTVKPRRTKKP